ncbi:GH12008 [Drosophila grimshawi]|uniref:GH12008 n=1 Tax=Drosophila grimshawi TaxID=7222 RepID=B4JKS1_DROGR|nr:GH12008 [Drosophila grimshawi]
MTHYLAANLSSKLPSQVVPLSCERVAPLQSNQQHVGLHSYCFMIERQNLCQCLGRMVYSMDVSPTYLLTTLQKNRLRDVMLKKNVSLADDLQPIIDDLYEKQSDPMGRKNEEQWKYIQKKKFLKKNCFDYYVDVMALDAFGNYHSVAFGDWLGMKRK